MLEAGLDEAGRGCLAGPVVAAAVILPSSCDLSGLRDSKQLSARARFALAPRIKSVAVAWSIGMVWQRRIEEINILQASLEAMSFAASRLKVLPDMLLIDGNRAIPENVLSSAWLKVHAGSPPGQKAIVGGDRTVPCISAASVLAKTCRDRLMASLARLWPGYGFEKHKGYGTKSHLLALRALGPCPLHRRTFKGVATDSQLSLASFITRC